MTVKMKTVSNIAAGVGVAIVLGTFVLNALHITNIPIGDAIKVGITVKGFFLTVDGTIWIQNVLSKNHENINMV